jgi:hypothetical protein
VMGPSSDGQWTLGHPILAGCMGVVVVDATYMVRCMRNVETVSGAVWVGLDAEASFEAG